MILIHSNATLFAAPPKIPTRCAPWETARETFAAGQEDEALAILRCELLTHKDNQDARLLLSNFLWWREETEPAISEAKEVLRLGYGDFLASRYLRSRISPRIFGASIQRVNTSSSEGLEFNTFLSWRYHKKDQVSFAASRQERIYPGAAPLRDHAFKIGHLAILNRRFYLESEVELIPNAIFLPSWRIGLAPHLSLGDESDLSLAFRVSHYATPTTTFLLSPTWRKPFGDRLEIATTAYLNFDSSETPSSLLAALTYQLLSITRVGGSFGFGRSLEGPGVSDGFHSWGLYTQQWIFDSLSVRLDLGRYLGNLRQETRIGLTTEWLF